MTDMLLQIYYFVCENLPAHRGSIDAEQALLDTFSREQKRLYEAFLDEQYRRSDLERRDLFFTGLRIGLDIP